MRQRCNHVVHTEPIWHNKTEHRKMARLRQRSRPVMPARKIQLKRTLLLLEGIPSLHSGNTRPSWLLTNLPSNWRIQHCNHMAQRWSPQVHTRLPVDRGNLCHEPCSTIPFSAHSILPANSQIHQHNCMGRQGRVAWSASLVARRAQRVAVQWEGSRDGGLGNTTLSCQLPRCFQSPLRS